jgi:ABC-2 type transport system ATP-binding protein
MSGPHPDPAAAPPLAIDVRHLTKRFGTRTVVDDVSLQVRRGEIMGFLGPNGSGKTTTLRLMCGLLRLDAGEGEVLGYDVRLESRRIKDQVGYMTQRFSLYEDLTIAENLELVAGLYRLPDPRAAVRDTLAGLGLTSRRDQLAGALSGGWKQRLSLADCIMHEPRLLLLDEPTAGVDPKARREFWDKIHGLAAGGRTVLVSTHYMDEAERCHRISYIAYGKLIAEGAVADVVAAAGLTTYVVAGPDLAAIARRLAATPGVDQVASFGAALHVVGRDPAALAAALAAVEAPGVTASPAETSLEDVFIQFMGAAEDNVVDAAATGAPGGRSAP